MNQPIEQTPNKSLFARLFTKRVISGWLLFLVAIAALLGGGVVFTAVLVAMCVFSCNEYLDIMKAKGLQPSVRITRFMTVLFCLASGIYPLVSLVPGAAQALQITPDTAYRLFPFLLTLGVCMSFFRLLFRHETPPAGIGDIATTILGFIYLGWMPAHLMLLRSIVPPGTTPVDNPLLQPGLAYVWAVLFGNFATDVFAYYCGKKFGKHALYPQVSPKKTVEGAVSGFFASIFWVSVVVYACDYWLFPGQPFHGQWWQGPLMGAMISIAAQLGDLCESLLKRDAGVKDSGTTIPGHGGFLDRGDGLIFAGPVAYYWVCVFILGGL